MISVHADAVEHNDGRAGIEADLKGDKRGLGLATIRKQRLAAQKIVVLLMQLAHNVLIWARQWVSKAAPRLSGYGIVRLIQEVWAIPGKIKLVGNEVRRVRCFGRGLLQKGVSASRQETRQDGRLARERRGQLFFGPSLNQTVHHPSCQAARAKGVSHV